VYKKAVKIAAEKMVN